MGARSGGTGKNAPSGNDSKKAKKAKKEMAMSVSRPRNVIAKLSVLGIPKNKEAAKIQKEMLKSNWEQKKANNYDFDLYMQAIMPGISKPEITRMHELVTGWTGNGYWSIRQAQQNHITTEDSKRIERFIEASPKWNGGDTWRIIKVNEQVVKSLVKSYQKGTKISQMGTASWTRNRRSYESDKEGKFEVVFKCEGKNRGTSIENYSVHQPENEIICSKKARYRIKSWKMKSDEEYEFVVECVNA